MSQLAEPPAAPPPAAAPLQPEEFAPHPSRRTRIDWADVARLLAAGWTTKEVARHHGCARQHVWRILRRSPALQRNIDAAGREFRLEAGAMVEALRPRVAEALSRAVDQGNVRVALWLADRLDLARLDYSDAHRADQVPAAGDPLDPATLEECDPDRAATDWPDDLPDSRLPPLR